MNTHEHILEITITVRKPGEGRDATEQMTYTTHHSARQMLSLITGCIRQQLEPRRRPGW